MKPITPQELADRIRRCQAGDEESSAWLFQRYKNLVFKTAYLLVGNSEEAEDILQEVFLHVYRSLAKYRSDKAAFTTWLYRITVNQSLNHRRRRRESRLMDSSSSLDQANSPSLEMLWIEKDFVLKALYRLNPKLRSVVILRYYAGLSYAEIAQVLHIPIGTVKSRLNLALKRIGSDLRATIDVQLYPEGSGCENGS